MKARAAVLLFLALCGCAAHSGLVRAGDLPRLEGRTVVLEGRVSRTPWQHLVDWSAAYPVINYIDFGESHAAEGQVVVYTKENLPCPIRVRITGRVIRVSGGSKRPDAREEYVEYQVRADHWECLD